MKRISYLLIIAVLGIAVNLTSCKKREGCMDPNSANFDPEAKKDGSGCIYPTILTEIKIADFDADICGTGGTKTQTSTWVVSGTPVDYSFNLHAGTMGSMTVIITDAAGATILNETVSSGGVNSRSGAILTAATGDWTISITASNFNGHGSLSMSY